MQDTQGLKSSMNSKTGCTCEQISTAYDSSRGHVKNLNEKCSQNLNCRIQLDEKNMSCHYFLRQGSPCKVRENEFIM